MNWLENKYISTLSNRLRNYSKKSGNTYNFSCPICGDSQVDKRKARAYIYTKQGVTLFHCHNCTLTTSFEKFLKSVDYQLFSEYKLELLKNKNDGKESLNAFIEKMKRPVFLQSGPLKGLKKISQLPYDHPAKIYISERKIPNPFHAKIFWCPNFFAWSNELIPSKFDKNALKHDEGRIVIPFFDKDKSMHAFQGRSLSPLSKTRYITLVNDESKPKIFGLDEVDFNKKVYVFEGPFDSMFIPNSIATAGGDLVSTISSLPKENLVICYDNEPRSHETKKKIDKCIIQGYNVCIFPSNLDIKDVNDMVLEGLSPDFIKHIIDTNTYRELAAKLALATWSKV